MDVHLLPANAQPSRRPAGRQERARADHGGADARRVFNPNDLYLEFKADYVHAEDRDTGGKLAAYHAVRVGRRSGYTGERLTLKVEGVRVNHQFRTAQYETATPGYNLLDASASYRLATVQPGHGLAPLTTGNLRARDQPHERGGAQPPEFSQGRAPPAGPEYPRRRAGYILDCVFSSAVGTALCRRVCADRTRRQSAVPTAEPFSRHLTPRAPRRLQRDARGGGARLAPEGLEKPRDVHFHGRQADPENLPDVGVPLALRDPMQHLGLSFGQPERRAQGARWKAARPGALRAPACRRVRPCRRAG